VIIIQNIANTHIHIDFFFFDGIHFHIDYGPIFGL
jgi:hypothetical protein